MPCTIREQNIESMTAFCKHLAIANICTSALEIPDMSQCAHTHTRVIFLIPGGEIKQILLTVHILGIAWSDYAARSAKRRSNILRTFTQTHQLLVHACTNLTLDICRTSQTAHNRKELYLYVLSFSHSFCPLNACTRNNSVGNAVTFQHRRYIAVAVVVVFRR